MAIPPMPASVRWPDPDEGPWRIVVWWRLQHGAMEPVGLNITSWADQHWGYSEDDRREMASGLPLGEDDVPFPPIDSRVLKDLPIGAIVAASREKLLQILSAEHPDFRWFSQEQNDYFRTIKGGLKSLYAEASASKPPSGRDLGDDHYRSVAETYAQAVKTGHPPTAAVAERFTISKSAAAKQVARARERGFLPKTSRGRVGKLREDL